MFNVKRNCPIPTSLAGQKTFKSADVLEALAEIFFDKCYLCETKNPTSINVEHLVAHRGSVEKMYDWNNLYFCCSRCNNVKLDRFNNLLDCTDERYDVCALIKHLPPHTPYQNRLTIQAMSPDPKAVETAGLLDEIFNGDKTINKTLSGVYLRTSVYKAYNRFNKYCRIYFSNTKTVDQKDQALLVLQNLMSRTQEHSTFLRWLVRGDAKLFELLGRHLE